MKKSESSVTSVYNEKSIAVNSIYENALVQQSTQGEGDPSLQLQFIPSNAQALKSSRKFKIALISSYAFLISLFVVIVYIADVLDPRFPF